MILITKPVNIVAMVDKNIMFELISSSSLLFKPWEAAYTWKYKCMREKVHKKMKTDT